MNKREKIYEKIVQEVMENYPEASGGNAMLCEGWDYKKCFFQFRDLEENKVHEITKNMLLAGMLKLVDDIMQGKIKLGFRDAAILDAGNWDSYSADALVQYSIFGEAIYG